MTQDENLTNVPALTNPLVNPEEPLQEKKPEKRKFLDSSKEESAPKPEKRNWEPIDVSTGVYRGKDLLVPKNIFEQHLRDDVKDLLPKFNQRNALAKAFSAKRGNKITKSEARNIIKGLEDEKKISHLRARELRKRFGARGTSF